jgi:hypothetical protein
MKAMTIQINAKVEWAVRKLQSGTWIGVCNTLGLTIVAKDDQELKSVIEEALSGLLLDVFADGEMDAFLRTRGWQAKSPLPANDQSAIENGVQFDLPFELLPWPSADA